MSETPKPIDPKVAEAIAKQKAQQEAVAKRVKELEAYIGKSFVQKGNPKGEVTKILGYAGAHVANGQSFHCFLAEKPGARWTPPATKFLEEHEEISIIKTETSPEII